MKVYEMSEIAKNTQSKTETLKKWLKDNGFEKEIKIIKAKLYCSYEAVLFLYEKSKSSRIVKGGKRQINHDYFKSITEGKEGTQVGDQLSLLFTNNSKTIDEITSFEEFLNNNIKYKKAKENINEIIKEVHWKWSEKELKKYMV